jgi:hypothetical protein
MSQLAASLTKAKKAFEKGDVARAGELIGAEQRHAATAGDEETLAMISEWVGQLRSLLTDDADDLAAFDRSLAAAATKITGGDARCETCGATLAQGVKFCGQCGAPVVDSAPSEIPNEPHVDVAAETPQAIISPPRAYAAMQDVADARRGRAFLVVLVAILVAAALVFGYFKFIRQSSTASKIQSIISSNGLATDPTCTQIGLIDYVGERSDLYNCIAFNGSAGTTLWDHCYVYAGGEAYDVTSNVQAEVKLEKLDGTYSAATDSFPCAD